MNSHQGRGGLSRQIYKEDKITEGQQLPKRANTFFFFPMPCVLFYQKQCDSIRHIVKQSWVGDAVKLKCHLIKIEHYKIYFKNPLLNIQGVILSYLIIYLIIYINISVIYINTLLKDALRLFTHSGVRKKAQIHSCFLYQQDRAQGYETFMHQLKYCNRKT